MIGLRATVNLKVVSKVGERLLIILRNEIE